MRKLIIFLIVAVLIAGLVGCEKFVSGYEADPLAPVDANSLTIFVGAELQYVMFAEGFPSFLASVWSQTIRGADRQFTSYQTYTVTRDDFNNDWNTAYAGALTNLRTVQTKAGAAGQLN